MDLAGQYLLADRASWLPAYNKDYPHATQASDQRVCEPGTDHGYEPADTNPKSDGDAKQYLNAQRYLH